MSLRFTRVRSWLYIWYREWCYGGFQWANRRMLGHYVGRLP